ncbi:unnamed protein product [Prorocentrum cordatum]|uniref:C2H2-type domain-containing protein n=1 Tax=Prorocentrum cordatum TaxID=2364126 RepID=A0ABN9RQ88_9DINO|nr:unnamed protein product [Polarella glacialis]
MFCPSEGCELSLSTLPDLQAHISDAHLPTPRPLILDEFAIHRWCAGKRRGARQCACAAEPTRRRAMERAAEWSVGQQTYRHGLPTAHGDGLAGFATPDSHRHKAATARCEETEADRKHPDTCTRLSTSRQGYPQHPIIGADRLRAGHVQPHRHHRTRGSLRGLQQGGAAVKDPNQQSIKTQHDKRMRSDIKTTTERAPRAEDNDTHERKQFKTQLCAQRNNDAALTVIHDVPHQTGATYKQAGIRTGEAHGALPLHAADEEGRWDEGLKDATSRLCCTRHSCARWSFVQIPSNLNEGLSVPHISTRPTPPVSLVLERSRTVSLSTPQSASTYFKGMGCPLSSPTVQIATTDSLAIGSTSSQMATTDDRSVNDPPPRETTAQRASHDRPSGGGPCPFLIKTAALMAHAHTIAERQRASDPATPPHETNPSTSARTFARPLVCSPGPAPSRAYPRSSTSAE